MKAVLLEEIGRVAVRDVPDLTMGTADILIRTAYAGICGSDIHAYRGTHPFRKPPVVLGHEISGTVAAVGPGVQGFRLGDSVTVMPYRSCGHCAACRLGHSNVCESKIVPGIKGWLGTFAEYFISRPEITYKLGSSTGLKRGVLAEPLAVAIHSMRRGRVERGEDVLVLGGGTIGLLTAIAAHKAGARSVVVTDLYEYNLGIALAFGCHVYRAHRELLEAAILTDYPGRFQAVFLTSGAPVTVGQALALVRPAGRIVATAIFDRPVLLPLLDLTLRELELIGTQIYEDADFQAALRWLDEDGMPYDRLIDHVYPLERAQEAIELLVERKENAIKVLLSQTE